MQSAPFPKANGRTPLASKPNNALRNHLLAALPADVLARLQPDLKPVSLPFGKVLYESGERLDYVYFPTTAIISLLYIMENGSTVEIGITGKDGLVGIALFLGGETTTNMAQVQIAGEAFRIKAQLLHNEFVRGGGFQQIFLRYMQAFLTQISQTAACNRLHFTEQKLCRWLLINHDLLQSNKLFMTHELIANNLGVHREGVTKAAIKLQQQGLISYAHGTIIMTDRKGLELIVCECFKVVKDEYNRLLGKYISKNIRY